MTASPEPSTRRRGRPRSAAPDSEEGTVRALDRGIQLLRILAKHGSLNLTDLSLHVGMPPSTVHRLLMTLKNRQLVDFEPAPQVWKIGIEAFRIGNAFILRSNLVEAGFEVMRWLVQETGETANLGIIDDGYVVFLSQVETPHPIRAFFPPGTRGPIHASGVGKMMLAEMPPQEAEAILRRRGLAELTPKTVVVSSDMFAQLETIRRQGWSLDDEESHVGMRCIAAPIYNAFGKAVAGVSISGPAARITESTTHDLAATVKRAAATITDKLGGEPRAPVAEIR